MDATVAAVEEVVLKSGQGLSSGGDRQPAPRKHSKDPKSSSPNTPPLRLLLLLMPHWMDASLTRRGGGDKGEVSRCPTLQERIQDQAQWLSQELMLRGKKKKYCPHSLNFPIRDPESGKFAKFCKAKNSASEIAFPLGINFVLLSQYCILGRKHL